MGGTGSAEGHGDGQPARPLGRLGLDFTKRDMEVLHGEPMVFDPLEPPLGCFTGLKFGGRRGGKAALSHYRQTLRL